MKKVSQPKLKNMPFPVLDMKEQYSIVAYLDELRSKVTKVRALQSDTQEALEQLMPSILDKAFKGELWF